MKLNVGSKNPNKVAAVAEVAALYPELFPVPEIVPVDVAIDLYGHPKSLEETVAGARARAKAAFDASPCTYSFGQESGLMAVPYTKTGYMEIGFCAVYDGHDFHLGMSDGFEWPTKVFDLIMNQGMDGSQAVKQAGLTEHEKLGTANGTIHILSNGQLTRKDHLKQAVMMAIVHLNHPELY